ncbi:MAG TPA: hypothetical protein VJP06_03380 [Thermoplasmata archaeon]|nr:hypothetical protein [Thermoplasmata archaeon]
MDVLPLALVAIFFASVAGFTYGRLRAFPQRCVWACSGCGQRNEPELDACWCCGRGSGEAPVGPRDVPIDLR